MSGSSDDIFSVPDSDIVVSAKFNAHAGRSIKSGQLIEQYPVVVVKDRGRRSATRMQSQGIPDTLCSWDEERDSIAIPLGYAGLIGFSENPNVEVVSDIPSRRLKVSALRDIRSGEHLTRKHVLDVQIPASSPVADIRVASIEPFPIRHDVGKYGYGVFATRLILEGEIVERTPAIRIPSVDRSRAGAMGLGSYLHDWDGVPDEGSRFKPAALSLGCGAIYNHSPKDAQLRLTMYLDTMEIEYRAVRDIGPDEEIFANYGWGSADGRLK